MKRIAGSAAGAVATVCGVAIVAMIGTAPLRALAQNLPPPGAYQPIPDYSGTNAGLLFRQAINNRFSGAQPISPAIVSLSIANLPTEQDGTLFYCIDCQKTSPCTSGGPGAWAMGQNGAWSCATGGSSLSMGGDVTGNSSASVVNTVEGGKTPVVTSGANAAAGTTTAAALNGFNVGGVIDVTNPIYGAVCSPNTMTATATAGSTVIPVNSLADFKVGQSIAIPLAGASCGLTTPTITTADLDSYQLNPSPEPPIIWQSPSAISNLCETDTTTSPYHNAACTTTYGYTIRSSGFNGCLSAPSAVKYVTGGPAVVSLANAIFLQWTTDPNAVGYVVNRCTAASCTPNYNSIYKVLANFPVGQTVGGTYNWGDIGNPYGHSEYTLTASAMAGILNTTITAVNPAAPSITVAVAPSQNGTFTIWHDDEPAWSAAEVAATPTEVTAGTVYAPRCNSPYTFGQANSLYGFNGLLIEGAGRNGGTAIEWLGPIGGIVFNMNFIAMAKLENIGVPAGAYNNTPGIVFDLDKYTGPSGNTYGPGGNPGGFSPAGATNDQLVRVECGESGVCVNFGGQSNVDTMTVRHLMCDEPNGFGGGICVRSASQETYNERITDGSQSNGRDYGFFGEFGSLYVDDFDFEGDVVDADLQVMGGGSITNSLTEGAQAFLQFSGANQELRLASNRIAPQPGPDGYFLYATGAVLFESNHVETGTMPIANMALQGNYNQENILIGNSFQNALGSPNASPYPATPYGAPITDYGGGQHTGGPYVEIGDVVGALTTPVMVPLSIVGGTASNAGAQRVTLTNGVIQNFADTSPTANYKPTVASCGTSAAASGTNFTPVITVGSSNPTTSCALTFNTNQAFANAPTCTFQDVTKGIAMAQSSLANTGLTLTAPSGVTDIHGDTINGTCVGN